MDDDDHCVYNVPDTIQTGFSFLSHGTNGSVGVVAALGNDVGRGPREEAVTLLVVTFTSGSSADG